MLTSKSILKPLIALLTLSFFSLSSAHASIDEQLELVDSSFASVDFYPLSNPDLEGLLGEYEEEAQSLMLTKGESYSLVAVCDDKCFDLDLYVFDKDGSVIGYDDDDTSIAIVDFTADYTGTYDAEVTMYDCYQQKCNYAVKSYVFKQ
ncbi:hypothetical protein [Psychrobacter lutiphocae]|uniref:hypothetical protein n=1 Tax=Psychrobacter lutiphocae TaxID=540500 RepID=UPI00036622CE|nr:hypothetical protein [Psychrobacter lutiphocae]